MSDVTWLAEDGSWRAFGTITTEAEDGPETNELYLDVRPSEEVDEDGEQLGWSWSVSVSEYDAGFGDATFDSGTEADSERAKEACVRAARALIASERGGTLS